MSTGVTETFCGSTICVRVCSVSHAIRLITPACVMKETKLDAGPRLTARGSATATGLDVSSSGGCFFGETASRRFENSELQIEVSFSTNKLLDCMARLSPAFRSRLLVNTKLPIVIRRSAEVPAPPLHWQRVDDRSKQAACSVLCLTPPKSDCRLPYPFIASCKLLPNDRRGCKPWQ